MVAGAAGGPEAGCFQFPMRAMLLRRGRLGRCRQCSPGPAVRTVASGGGPRPGPLLLPRGHWGGPECRNDARTGMAAGVPAAARCVQRFDGSLNSAIHTTYRISLRSSSMPEPRDPLPKVFTRYNFLVQSERRADLSVLVRPPSAAAVRGGGSAEAPFPPARARRGNVGMVLGSRGLRTELDSRFC